MTEKDESKKRELFDHIDKLLDERLSLMRDRDSV